MAGLAGSSPDMPLSLLLRLLIIALIFFTNVTIAEEIILTVNVKKPLAMTSDKFLSYTLDPTVILTGNFLTKNPDRSVKIARALSPAYVRIGGPRSNSYSFVRSQNSQKEKDNDFTITETNWIDVHRWAENAGLEILACIEPRHIEIVGRDPVWDSRNALDLISFSDHMGFNTSWQLGYECQTRCDVAGSDLGRAVTRLRSMLDAFPRYSNSVVTGPDVVAYRTKKQLQYLQDYLSVAGNALSAITWHPNFSGITLDDEGVSMHHDNLANDKDALYKMMGRSISKKSLWLAESKPEECKKQFLGALVWTRRLGNAARLGIQVIMRQPKDSDFLQPTPDYWVSVLHKSLVGREVLDARIANGNRSHVHFYCHCTRSSPRYEKGSLTIFGINLTPAKILINIKGLKIKTIDKYILLPGFDNENRMFSETVLLNNRPLNLADDQKFPEIKPAVLSNGKGVGLKLPSGGIGFWVLPGLKIKSCGGLEEDGTDDSFSKKSFTRHEDSEIDADVTGDRGVEEKRNDVKFSTEEPRYSLRSSKNRRRRKNRESEENDSERLYESHDDDMNLERFERLLRKRDSYDDVISSSRGRRAYEDFDDKNHDESSKNDDPEKKMSLEMMDKLVKYEKHLREYENIIKMIESRSLDEIVDKTSSDEIIDSDKIIEAVTLISKIENAMDKLEIFDVGTNTPNLDKDHTSGLAAPSKDSASLNDTFLGESIKSDKIKLSSLSTRIKDQLQAIYRMLADVRIIEKQDAVVSSEMIDGNLSRGRREIDEKFVIDPLGLRKMGMLRRLIRISEDARQRRNRRRGKDDRNVVQSVVLDTKFNADSEENNFYGFEKFEPIENFPEGDVHLMIEDNVKNVPMDTRKETETFGNKETSNFTPEDDDDTWINEENIQFTPVPVEFFESVKIPEPSRVHENQKDHSEIWRIETYGGKIDDSSNTGIDEMATIRAIVHEQHRDIRENERTKELPVEKLIARYDDQKAQSDNMAAYENKEFTKNSVETSTIVDVPYSRMIQAANRQNPPTKRKYVKDLTLGVLTDLDSMKFGKSIVSSAEERAFGNYDVDRKVSSDSAKRTKRSAENLLEDVLDREMIFQDDNNLKDCDCRVTRSAKILNNRDNASRDKRCICHLAKCHVRRRIGKMKKSRRNRKRVVRATSKPLGDLDENHTYTPRSKRDVVSSNEETMEFTTKVTEFIRDDSKEVEPSTTEETGLDELEISTNHDSIVSVEDEILDYNDWTKEYAEDSSSLEDGNHDGEEIKSLTLEEEMINVTVENTTAGTNSAIKRYIQETTDQNYTVEPDETESSEKSAETVESSNSKDSSKSKVKFFRDCKNKKERTKMRNDAREIYQATPSEETSFETTPSETTPSETTPSETTPSETIPSETTPSKTTPPATNPPETTTSETKILPSHKVLATSSSQNIVKLVESPKIGTNPKNQDSSIVIPYEIAKETIKNIEQANANDTRNSTINSDPEKFKLIADITEIPTISSDNEKIKLPRSIKNDTATTRKTTQRMRKVSRIIDPVKLRESRLPARLSPLAAPKRDNDGKKLAKSKRAEQLEKLQEKLRQKREELVNDYHDELLSDLEETMNYSDVNENRRTREIIEILANDEELRDIVDSEKFEYLKRNKPINYEATEDASNVRDVEVVGKKYIPEIIDIARPVHATRERRIKSRKQIVGATIDPKLLAHGLSEEASNAEAMRRRLKEDLTDHKIERRDDKSYYGIVESLENSKIYEKQLSSYERVSDDERSVEMQDSIELGENLDDPRSAKNMQRLRHSCDEYGKFENSDEPSHEDYHGISESNEKRVRSLENFEDSRRSVRNVASKNNMCTRENTEETLTESSDELLNVAKEQNNYETLPIDDTRIENDNVHSSKKRNLKISDYELDRKYKCPKYARLAVDRSKIVNEERTAKKNIKDQERSRVFNSEEKLQDIGPKSTRRKIARSDSEAESWMLRRTKKNPQYRNLAMIDSVDLDDVLNSRHYELMMLIPVNKVKNRNRQRRHVGNEITRDLGKSLTNDITIEMIPKNNEIRNVDKKRNKDVMIYRDSSIVEMNKIKSNQPMLSDILRDKEDDDNSMVDSSTIVISEGSKMSKKYDVKGMNGYEMEEIVRSVPKNVLDHREKTREDERLPDLLEEALPKLEATVTGGLGKARRISESFEKFIDDFDDGFNQRQLELEIDSTTPETNANNHYPISSDVFNSASTNVKKFFDFLSALLRIFRSN